MTDHLHPTQSPVAALKALAAAPPVQQLLQEQPAPLDDILKNWLAELMLLKGIPFDHLVPDERMLPKESVRFFFLDPNWLDSLVDGALSAGVGSSRDLGYHRTVDGVVVRSVTQALPVVRAQLRGVPSPEGLQVTDMSGLLLRSAVVSGWPGLEVKAFADTGYAASQPLAPLRIERLAPDILLAIFAGVARRVTIAQPSEGLHFGIQLMENGLRIAPRSLQAGQCGRQLGGASRDDLDKWAAVGFRGNAADRVINVAQLASDTRAAIGNFGETVSAFGAGAFAIQMVAAPQRKVFEAGAASSMEVGSPIAVAAAPAPVAEKDRMRQLFGG